MYNSLTAPGGEAGKPGVCFHPTPTEHKFLELSYFCLLDFINFKFKKFQISLNFSKFYLKKLLKFSIKFTKFVQILTNFSQTTIQFTKTNYSILE